MKWISSLIIPPMWVQLHTGNPGPNGSDNISLGNVERKLWNPAHHFPLPEWENVGGVTETITDVTGWDQPAFGNLLVRQELNRNFWSSGVTWWDNQSFRLNLNITVCAA